MTLEERYYRLIHIKSDINEHMPVLRALASRCPVIVEFGVRHAVSTVALLMGRPEKMTSFDINPCPHAEELEKEVEGFTFIVANSLEVPPQPSDLLFLDTFHSYEQLKGELDLHGSVCRKLIAIHDTELFGESGELGTGGINRAWEEWLEARPMTWYRFYRSDNNNGLTVLARRDADL